MEAIGQLAAGVAHDLNNALAAVVGHLQLLQNEVSEQGRSSFHTALSGCERASSLIQQLLGFSRQGKYNPQVIRARDVVTTTVEFLGKVIDKDIEVRIGEDSEGLSIHGDFSQLQQVVTNLILNATQAISGPGAITFDFGRREVLHPERYNPRAHTGFFVALTVSDTGCGISEEHLDKIFEPFFTTKRDREGTGLGLSMVYGIMQNHSGWVEVDSTIGRGTRFTLMFPQALGVAASGPDDGVETTPLLKPRRLASGHVVVIDDEPVLVDLARQFLANAGVEVTGFTDPNEALRWYRREWRSVDIIVLDMKMPKVDGPACFRELRDINPAARVVVMSGFVQDTAAQKLMEAGVAHFFEKPLRYPELVAWIVEELARHQQIAV
jgi:CheY-like chemotaxis protein